MPRAYMITNRGLSGSAETATLTGQHDLKHTHFFVSEKSGAALCSLSGWQKVDYEAFRKKLIEDASGFRNVDQDFNETQQHVSLFVHGYNNSWKDAVERYNKLRAALFDKKNSLGVPILFTWPSDASVAAYLSDREDARASAPQLADVFVRLHEHLLTMQRVAAQSVVRRDAIEGRAQTAICLAKVSIIAHSMGNYVVQKALAIAARKLNSPQLVTLVHQLVMVSADVDNDIFQIDQPDQSDGSLMANLCYRITALHSGLDQTLAASAGLKHFGTRRLGRSGLSEREKVWDNVCSADITPIIKDAKGSMHSAPLDEPKSLELIRDALKGVDRKVLLTRYGLSP
jgi:esterase/lipase superfamily enzyme